MTRGASSETLIQPGVGGIPAADNNDDDFKCKETAAAGRQAWLTSLGAQNAFVI